MIVILEGVNGAGKTTLAYEFVKLGFTRVKPFLSDTKRHWDTELEARDSLSRCGISTNTFVEDMFVAEVISQIPSTDIILDRSLPSAIVYGLVDGTVKSHAHADDLLATWLHSIKRARTQVVYVWMDVTHAETQERSAARARDFETFTEQRALFEHCFNRIVHHIDAMRLDVTSMPPIEVANKVRTYATSLSGVKKK